MKISIETISYCCLDCSSCIIRWGRLGYKATSMLNQMKKNEFITLAKGLAHARPEIFSDLIYCEHCIKTLKTIQNLDCKKTCRSGGGSINCEIRKCCIEKKYDGCWACDESETCLTLGFLRPIHGEANIENIKFIRKNGIGEFLITDKKKWYRDKSENKVENHSKKKSNCVEEKGQELCRIS